MKYELDESTATYFETPTQSHTLCRVKALKDFADVKAGDLGGFIEDYRNLSQDGNCWVYDNAKVMGSATVKGDAKIKNEAIVSQKATVQDRAIVKDHATVSGNATIRGNATVSENTTINSLEHIYVTDDTQVKNKALITGHVDLKGQAIVQDNAKIKGYATINGTAIIKGNVTIDGSATIANDAVVASDYDYMVIKNPYGETMTYTASNKRWNVNYFNRTSENLIAKGYEHSQSKGQVYEQCVDFVTKQLGVQAIENPKYELLSDDTIKLNHVVLRRLRALRNFGSVKTGELGGYIENENNLHHDDTA